MNTYLKIAISCPESISEVLIAELSVLGFDSFQETEEGIDAFVEKDIYAKEQLLELLHKYNLGQESFSEEILENKNWNEEWERNFEPVIIEDKIYIRAPFHHPKDGIEHEIIIEPKMSFGTGHHETTFLMSLLALNIEMTDKNVLDAGTGTGILSILAYQLGAKSITSTDIDDWCIENSKENLDLNDVKNYEILKGPIDQLTFNYPYDVILANINKNVLLAEIKYYSQLLVEGGKLLLSGFYDYDEEDIVKEAVNHKLQLIRSEHKNNWACLLFTKGIL